VHGRLVSIALVALVLTVLGSLTVLFPTTRRLIRSVVPARWIVELNGYRLGYATDHTIRVRMPDGVTLAASLYLPRTTGRGVGTIYVRHPYDRLKYGEGLQAAEFFASHGYAVLVQDIRGKFGSGGEFIPYAHATADGAATLDWIVQQPWSNGRVGTWGCSALGELQFALARARHPAHAAMVPLGAGGAMGSAMRRYSYFGLFEGGVFQLASGAGWFIDNGAKTPGPPPTRGRRAFEVLSTLPVADIVQQLSPGPNAYDDFIRRPLTDPFWRSLDYIGDADVITTPAFVLNNWGDQTVGETLALAEFTRRTSPPAVAAQQRVVIGPGAHCDHADEFPRTVSFGDLSFDNAGFPYFEHYLAWFDYHLRSSGDGLAGLPPYSYYMMGEARWLSSATWPPETAAEQRWFVASDGAANTSGGNGRLALQVPATSNADGYRYDPADPVPTRGGSICCTGNPATRQGHVDQREIERRADVLVYTSPPLEHALRIAGPLHAHLTVSSSAKDTDFVARLVHVWPDGRSINIQEGAVRARYRTGIEKPEFLIPGEPVSIVIDMRATAYTIPKGHQLRLHVTSSSFPRLERNLNTGGSNFDETAPIVAVNKVYHGPSRPSFLQLYALPVAP
jgi:putative CocE/NonD family hydrolase